MSEIFTPSLIVWLVPLNGATSAELVEAGLRLLDSTERERAARCLTPEARAQFIVGRATVRELLSSIVPVAPTRWVFGSSRYGKPIIVEPIAHRIQFNLSHTPGLVACVASAAGPVGIDVEQIRPVPPGDGPLMLMSDRDRSGLAGVIGVHRDRRYFQIWTAKEAYAKAIGRGVANSLRFITVERAATEPSLNGPPPDLADWHLHRLDLGPFHTGVLATTTRDRPIIQWRR